MAAPPRVDSSCNLEGVDGLEREAIEVLLRPPRELPARPVRSARRGEAQQQVQREGRREQTEHAQGKLDGRRASRCTPTYSELESGTYCCGWLAPP